MFNNLFDGFVDSGCDGFEDGIFDGFDGGFENGLNDGFEDGIYDGFVVVMRIEVSCDGTKECNCVGTSVGIVEGESESFTFGDKDGLIVLSLAVFSVCFMEGLSECLLGFTCESIDGKDTSYVGDTVGSRTEGRVAEGLLSNNDELIDGALVCFWKLVCCEEPNLSAFIETDRAITINAKLPMSNEVAMIIINLIIGDDSITHIGIHPLFL